MSATAQSKFFWTDWLGDQAVRRLTLEERGLWIDMLAIAATASPFGYVTDQGRPLTHEEIARLVGADPVIVAKLLGGILEKGVASVDRAGRIYNRRMVRDAEIKAKRKRAGSVGGAANQLKIHEQKFLLEQMLKQNGTRANSNKNLELLDSECLTRSHGNPARSLATALPTGALARSPSTEQADGKHATGKSPVAATRAELEAAFARRRAKETNGKAH